jgi:ribonucleotide reductase alpha subunit
MHGKYYKFEIQYTPYHQMNTNVVLFLFIVVCIVQEIVEYTSPDEISVCNLASIALPMFVTKDKKFDFVRFMEVTAVATRSLNKVIDVNYYPMKQAEYSNLKNRPIGLGPQGKTIITIT